MAVLPMYDTAAVVDAVVLNTIEFRTGTNPMAPNDGTRTISLPEANLTIKNTGGTYEFTQVIDGKQERVRVETRDGITIAKDRSGNVLAKSALNRVHSVCIRLRI